MKGREGKECSKPSVADKIIKWVYFIAYFALNIFLVGLLSYEGMYSPAENGIGYAVAFFIVCVIGGSMGNGVLIVLALIGLIVAAFDKRNSNCRKRVGFYVFMAILPVVTELFVIGFGYYMPNLLG